jgi:hypothetical protein
MSVMLSKISVFGNNRLFQYMRGEYVLILVRRE